MKNTLTVHRIKQFTRRELVEKQTDIKERLLELSAFNDIEAQDLLASVFAG